MRKITTIIVGIIVVASCVPWLRHQRLFSILVGVIAVTLVGLMVFRGGQALFAWSRKIHQRADSMQTGWWPRRFRKLLLSAILILVLMLTIPHFVVTMSAPYKLAVAIAYQSPQFKRALGVPVTEAWFSESQMGLGNSATADLLIPVHGPKRTGKLTALAIKDDGHWRVTSLVLKLTQPDEQIDLLRSTYGATKDHR